MPSIMPSMYPPPIICSMPTSCSPTISCSVHINSPSPSNKCKHPSAIRKPMTMHATNDPILSFPPRFSQPHSSASGPLSRPPTRSRSPQLLLRLLVPMRNKPVQETARLALCPAVLLRLGEFLFEVLLGLFVRFFVVMVVRWERGRGKLV